MLELKVLMVTMHSRSFRSHSLKEKRLGHPRVSTKLASLKEPLDLEIWQEYSCFQGRHVDNSAVLMSLLHLDRSKASSCTLLSELSKETCKSNLSNGIWRETRIQPSSNLISLTIEKIDLQESHWVPLLSPISQAIRPPQSTDDMLQKALILIQKIKWAAEESVAALTLPTSIWEAARYHRDQKLQLRGSENESIVQTLMAWWMNRPLLHQLHMKASIQINSLPEYLRKVCQRLIWESSRESIRRRKLFSS